MLKISEWNYNLVDMKYELRNSDDNIVTNCNCNVGW